MRNILGRDSKKIKKISPNEQPAQQSNWKAGLPLGQIDLDDNVLTIEAPVIDFRDLVFRRADVLDFYSRTNSLVHIYLTHILGREREHRMVGSRRKAAVRSTYAQHTRER